MSRLDWSKAGGSGETDRQQEQEAAYARALERKLVDRTARLRQSRRLDKIKRSAKFAAAPKTTLRCSCGNEAEIPAVAGLRFRCQCGLRYQT